MIPTGALPLDAALGIGGVPRGRIIEVYGPESSGKTTLALQILAEAQALGGIVAFIDAEHALDPPFTPRASGSISTRCSSPSPTPASRRWKSAICSFARALSTCVIVDSVAALVPVPKSRGEMGDTTVGLQARLMSQALRKLAGSLSKSNTTCIFINQLREKIGVMFGNPETTTGGRALKFFSSVRIDIRRIDSIKQNGDVVGNRVRAKVVKNKVAPPFRQASSISCTARASLGKAASSTWRWSRGVAKKSGAWYTYGEERLGQGPRGGEADAQGESPICGRNSENKVREAYEIPVIERPAETSRSRRRQRAARRNSAIVASKADILAALRGGYRRLGSRPSSEEPCAQVAAWPCPAEDDAVCGRDTGASCAQGP